METPHTACMPLIKPIQYLFPSYILSLSKIVIQGLSQNWCSFSLDGFVTPSIGIPMKRVYSKVHFLSNKHPQTSVCQIDLKLRLVLWKSSVYFSKRRKEKSEQKHKPIHSHHSRFPKLYIWHFLSQNTVHLQLNLFLFFRPIFLMVVSNLSSECIQRLSGFPGSPGHLFWSSTHVVHVSTLETTSI